jgi:uncharacterized membrane protein
MTGPDPGLGDVAGGTLRLSGRRVSRYGADVPDTKIADDAPEDKDPAAAPAPDPADPADPAPDSGVPADPADPAAVLAVESTAVTGDPVARPRRVRVLVPAMPRARFWHGLITYALPGAWVGLVFVCLSFTPSLVPRPALFQGVVCGINGAIGYAVGVLGAWIWRQFADRPARPARGRSWQVFGVVAVVAFVVSAIFGLIWQQDLRDLMGVPHEAAASMVLVPVVGAVVFALVIGIARGLRRAYRALARLLSRWMGARAARGVGWALVVVLVVGLVSGVLVDGIISATDASFSVVDTTTPDGAVQPTSDLRSGGPGSLVGWDTLGYQGRGFTGRGPTQADIAGFTGDVAKQPIRVYAGIRSADSIEARAALAVDDLARAGGFARKYLLVVGTTGTGWVDPSSIASLEYETGGDIASIAIQYSYLPSWASVVVDRDRAAQAGRELFETVYEHWSALPATNRPKLLITGESLGSYAIESAFSGEFDLRNRVDGGLLSGPPNFNDLHRQFTDDRDPGSTEVQPIYRDGRTIRFTNDPSQPIPPANQPWTGTRILYLQNPSDPVVWVSTSLILHRPDWLREAPGRDVLPHMTWIPLVTFWQVTIDMLEPVDVPTGHAHRYSGEFVDGWAAIIQPTGWTQAKATTLQAIIAGQPAE